jgi:hypothetical protein
MQNYVTLVKHYSLLKFVFTLIPFLITLDGSDGLAICGLTEAGGIGGGMACAISHLHASSRRSHRLLSDLFNPSAQVFDAPHRHF